MAEKILLAQINGNKRVEFIRLFGFVKGKNSGHQLTIVDRWCHEDELNIDAYICGARISFNNMLWGKAKSYLTASIDIKPTLEAYSLLTQVLNTIGETELANQYANAGLALAMQKQTQQGLLG